MCYSNPAKSLQIARERMTAEQWTRFEREFDDFCVVQGLPDKWAYWPTYDWAKWAFFQGRQLHLINNASVSNDRQMALKGIAEFFDDFGDPEGAEVIRHYSKIQQLKAERAATDAYFERIAIAMMTDEQAEASLERWRGVKGEAE